MVNKGSHFADFVRFRPYTYNLHAHSTISAALRAAIRKLCILKMLYTGCSMKETILQLLSRSTYYFNNNGLIVQIGLIVAIQFGLIVANQNKKLKQGHYTFWKCSILDATWFVKQHKFQYQITFKMHFGLVVANQDQKLKSRHYLYILKTLYTGCSMKEALSLLLSRST